MANNAPEQVRLSVSAIHHDLTFSKRDVYVWVRLNPKHYEFQNDVDRERLVEEFSLALANLLTSEENALDCQLIVTSGVFDEQRWKNNLLNQPSTRDASPYFNSFLDRMASHIWDFQFRTKAVYLGVNLGSRNEFNPTKATFAIPGFDKIANLFTGEVDEYLSDKELEFWEEKARYVRYSLMESTLGANEVSGAELAYIIRKQMYPAMTSPTVEDLALSNAEQWGVGELQTLAAGEVDNKPMWLEITQDINGQTFTGYRATLCFSKFPEVMSYPEKEPWIHFSSLLSFPIDIFSRFSVEPSRKVRKQVTNKIKAIEDQAVNMTSAGGQVSLEVQAQRELGQYLEFALGKDETPWLYARHRIVVEARTEQELKERARSVIDHYKSLGITVMWSRGDQLDLFLEGIPNDRVRLSSYYQRHELAIIGAGVPTGSGGAGDLITFSREDGAQGWLGAYVGYTTSRVIEPVFLSMHSAIAKNKAPGLVITGAPGSGKSFCAFTITYNMVLSGVWTIYIDPKADALPMANLPGVIDPTIINLADGMDGLLDPFAMTANPGEQKDLVIETVGLFVGGIDKLGPKEISEVSKALEIVSKDRNPSLSKVVEMLLASQEAAGEALGHRLSITRELPFARLCFDAAGVNNHAAKLRPDRSLTIITLLGLDLPSSATPRDEYSNQNRLAVAIMYLLTSFTRKLMRNENSNHPKAIVIDEAWAVTNTTQGAKLVMEVARMGRSLNTAMILVSQNAGDFLGESVTNSVSTRMAFRSDNSAEIENVLAFFGLEHNKGNANVIRNLKVGECLLRDADNRIARVQIEGWNNEQRVAFETNPERKRRKAEEDAL